MVSSYRVKIAAYKSGQLVIGAAKMKGDKNKISDIDYVYGSQLPYRVVAKTPNGNKLMTKTKAKKHGYKIYPN